MSLRLAHHNRNFLLQNHKPAADSRKIMSKQKLSVSLRDEQVGRIDELEYDSRSEAIRELVDRGFEYEDLQQENERLRNEKQTILNQRNENKQLVEYLQKEREIQMQERMDRQERRKQPVWERLRNWVFGES